MIQGSINNLLVQAAVFARLDPDLGNRQVAYKAQKEIEHVGKQIKTWSQAPGTEVTTSEEGGTVVKKTKDIDEAVAMTEQVVAAAKTRFEANPTAENWEKYSKGKNKLEEVKKDIAAVRQVQADRQAKTALELEQKRVGNSKELSDVGKKLVENAPVTYGRRETDVDKQQTSSNV